VLASTLEAHVADIKKQLATIPAQLMGTAWTPSSLEQYSNRKLARALYSSPGISYICSFLISTMHEPCCCHFSYVLHVLNNSSVDQEACFMSSNDEHDPWIELVQIESQINFPDIIGCPEHSYPKSLPYTTQWLHSWSSDYTSQEDPLCDWTWLHKTHHPFIWFQNKLKTSFIHRSEEFLSNSCLY